MNERLVEFVADFETTVKSKEWLSEHNLDSQKETEVWSAALLSLEVGERYDEVFISNRIEDFMDVLNKVADVYKTSPSKSYRVVVYFHGLSFDGSFILNYLETQGYKAKMSKKGTPVNKAQLSKSGEYTYFRAGSKLYSISILHDTIEVKNGEHTKCIIDFIDTTSILRGSLRRLAKDFNTKHQKLEMDYIDDNAHAGGDIPAHKVPYIKNDVYVLKEVILEFRKYIPREAWYYLTIGRISLNTFKQALFVERGLSYNDSAWHNKEVRKERQLLLDKLFPKLIYRVKPCMPTVENFVRLTYNGGMCFMRESTKGYVVSSDDPFVSVDNNSLYPYVAHTTEGGNEYKLGIFPVGVPEYYCDTEWYFNEYGEYYNEGVGQSKGIDSFKLCLYNDIVSKKTRYYFLHVRCGFKIKEDGIRCIKVMSSAFHRSDIYRENSLPDEDGGDDVVDLWLTLDDFTLLIENYTTSDLEVLEFYRFDTEEGLFDNYIDFYSDMKAKAREEGNKGKETTAKYLLNNLIGMFAIKAESNLKKYIFNDDSVDVKKVKEHVLKETMYVPISAVVNAKARRVLVDSIKSNRNKWLYSDTDSMFLACNSKGIQGIHLDSKKMGSWKVEHIFTKAIFFKKKLYALYELQKGADPTLPENYKWSITAAGMSARSKSILEYVLNNKEITVTNCRNGVIYNTSELGKLTRKESSFIQTYLGKEPTEILRIGLQVPGQLVPNLVKGGCVLREDYYTLGGILN